MVIIFTKTDKIKALMEEVRELTASEENQKRIKLWQPEEETARDHWRGKAKNSTTISKIPFTVEPEIPLWSKILNFSVRDYYTDPEIYLESQLRMMVYRFKNFKDHTPVGKEIPIWLSTTFESSLFGAKTIIKDNKSPWIDREPVFKTKQDLAKKDYPDFYESGLMPVAHRFYTEINELLADDFHAIFPEWGRSPFGVAFHTRGHDRLLVDIVEDPDFVHDLMRFITDSRKKWTEERADFLGQDVHKGNLYNDEVNTPTLSPPMVEEFVLPYEQELSEFHGGIAYWHSCGNTTGLVEIINRIPDLEMFHIGPWTEVKKARSVMGEDMSYEICLNPIKDVQRADKKTMEDRLRQIIQDAYGAPFTIRADGFHQMNSLSRDIEIIETWINVANRVCEEELANIRR